MIKMKKVLVAFITLLSIICISSAASAASTNISIGSATVSQGDTTTLDVMINNVTNAGATKFNLTYDPTIVQVTAASNGDFDATAPALGTSADGYITITAYQISSPGLNGTVLVTTLTLQAVGVGTSGLDFNSPTSVSDNTPQQTDIDIDWINGMFTVTTEVPPTLVTYTITNTTITPPQTAIIDVAFSERVSAIIKIEDASGNLVNELYSSAGVTDPDEKTWYGTYTNDTTVPDGVYTVNVSGVSTTTGLSVVDTSKTIIVTTAVSNQLPTAVITSPTADGTYRVGDEVSFLSTGSSDPDGTIVSYSWTFGDGDTSTVANTAHTYTTAGSMTVMLTVTDNDGATNTTTVTINVLETGAVSVTLYEGWNLIAVPVNDPDANTAAELASKIAGCREVVKWDATTQMYVPYSNINSGWTGINFAITGGMGIFVNVESATTVGFTGNAWS